MTSIKRTFSVFLVGCFVAVISLFSISKQISYASNDNECVIEFADEDCYTYERIFINGQWWIYVYDCDGVFLTCYLDDED